MNLWFVFRLRLIIILIIIRLRISWQLHIFLFRCRILITFVLCNNCSHSNCRSCCNSSGLGSKSCLFLLLLLLDSLIFSNLSIIFLLLLSNYRFKIALFILFGGLFIDFAGGHSLEGCHLVHLLHLGLYVLCNHLSVIILDCLELCQKRLLFGLFFSFDFSLVLSANSFYDLSRCLCFRLCWSFTWLLNVALLRFHLRLLWFLTQGYW